MLPPVRPALDPLAHRAAIQALEAQRGAYARFARTMDAHRTALAGGSGDAATAASDAAARGHDELADGARRLGPLVAAADASGDTTEREEVARRLDAMLREAQAAEVAIHNLTTQLEAWRDAYGRQLAEVGLTPGAGGGGDDTQTPSVRPAGGPVGYGRRGHADAGPHPSSLIDRKG